MKKILIIEDEAIIAEEIKYIIESLGHEVIGIIMNGDKAINLLPSINADLILLDIQIKGSVSGIELAHLIRKKYHTPFVFLTAFSDAGTLEKVKETLPYGYIVKPFDETDIKVAIELALYKFSMETADIQFDKALVEKKFNITLSEREYGILKFFREGLSYQDVADKLFLSINTVKSYQKRLYQIFEVNSKVELIKKIG
ncbi:response regulator transcription factor [Aquiflexum lacus]|uniref:response regulator transcription factor n=1 Tax=Aquiflexum lacus TaxID=2483805 RepID=UPI0018951597|nr:response regulator transcription factor [Aquiflexum lacus]